MRTSIILTAAVAVALTSCGSGEASTSDGSTSSDSSSVSNNSSDSDNSSDSGDTSSDSGPIRTPYAYDINRLGDVLEANGELPHCSDVWADGLTIPDDFTSWCNVSEGQDSAIAPVRCTDNRILVSYMDPNAYWWGFAGGPTHAIPLGQSEHELNLATKVCHKGPTGFAGEDLQSALEGVPVPVLTPVGPYCKDLVGQPVSLDDSCEGYEHPNHTRGKHGGTLYYFLTQFGDAVHGYEGGEWQFMRNGGLG